MKKTLKYAFLKSLPVMAGYLVLGFGFGVISERSGYGIIWAFLMSTFIYAGSMQYVAVDLLTSGAGLIASALTTLMVNSRHLFYGISMLKPYQRSGLLKPYLVFGLTDETYSLVCKGEPPCEDLDFHRYSFFLTLFNQSYWIIGSVLGALVGAKAPIDFAGIEFAMTALFITIFVEQWRSSDKHAPQIIGVLCSVLCLLIFGKERFLIPAMLSISAVLIVGRKFIEREERSDEH